MGYIVHILHFMNQSADGAGRTSTRRRRVAQEISRHARRLCEEHGLDGFTMDQLADSVGVSRRTLFNYVPGKVDAVLGVAEDLDPARIETFLSGGPTGHLLTDVKEMICLLLDEDDPDPAEVLQVRRIIAADPRLSTIVHERFAELMQRFSELVAQREGGDVDPRTLRLVADLAISLFDVALDDSLADGDRTLAQHYALAFDDATALFQTRPA